jgi:hypothetical protein
VTSLGKSAGDFDQAEVMLNFAISLAPSEELRRLQSGAVLLPGKLRFLVDSQ